MFASIILNILGSGVLGKVADILQKRADAQVQMHGQAAKAGTDVALAEISAQIEQQRLKKEMMTAEHMWWGYKVIILGVSLPFVTHVAAIALDSTFKFGWGIPRLPGEYAQMEKDVLMSFFIITGAAGGLKGIVALLKR